jgi:hypothetical protein
MDTKNTIFDVKGFFGNEYPAALTRDGERTPLHSEDRWSRIYSNDLSKTWQEVSRFLDGSVTMTFEGFSREWPTWGDPERMNFCRAFHSFKPQADYLEILRYIMREGESDHWSAIAVQVARYLPQDEAFLLLTQALDRADLDNSAYISLGISHTKHPDAERVLRVHLAALWSHPALWDDDSFRNPFAFAATCCLASLLGGGAPTEDFIEKAKSLANHPCSGNRNSCVPYLSPHLPWLKE